MSDAAVGDRRLGELRLEKGVAVGKSLAVEPLPAARRQAPPTSSAAAAPTVLECFQVAPPVLTPHGASYQAAESDGSEVFLNTGGSTSGEACTVLLMEHSFAWSYGMPFIGAYTPPSCAFNRVVMNFTVTSQGRQFDRLALMYLGDTEVWRTSTAEPVQPPGIRWTYLKDMTPYLSLWKTAQKLIFDLGNLIDDKYTGPFNTTLTATFFTADDTSGAAPPSDLVIPISKRQSAADAVSQFTLPADDATNTISSFPRNANRAVFSVSACGQASEEFWWSNVPQSDALAFNATAGAFPAYSPFREVQVLIDGQLAGVQWPFPVIFTGGVVPSLHRPIVGIDAFDLREHEIDITPFLPLLCDGASHTFTIRVAGIDDTAPGDARLTQTVGDSWYVTGKIFVWLDADAGSVTTGDSPVVSQSGPTITLSHELGKTANGTNETLAYTTLVQRRFVATNAQVKTQRSSGGASWSQTLTYSNKGYISGFGYNQINDFSVVGADVAASSGSNGAAYTADYRYPLFANQTYSVSPQGNLTLRAHVVQGKQLLVAGVSAFPNGLEAFVSTPATEGKRFAGGSLLATTKEGTASFFQTGDGRNSSGFGTSAQVLTFGGVSARGAMGDRPDAELYFRNVTAVNGTVVYDRERVAGVGGGRDGEVPGGGQKQHYSDFAPAGAPRVFMGRIGGMERANKERAVGKQRPMRRGEGRVERWG